MDKKIIVAEDSLTIQKVFELTFLRTGYHVTYIDRGEELVAMARQLSPDLVICDLTLPDIDGYETIKRLKGDPVTSDIPALLVAGSLEPVDEEKYRMCGADGLLQKPFESQELLDKVEEMIAESAPPEEEAEDGVGERAEGWDFSDVFQEVEMGVEGVSDRAPGILEEMLSEEGEQIEDVKTEDFAVGVDEISESAGEEYFQEVKEEDEDMKALDEILDEVPGEELEELDEIFDETVTETAEIGDEMREEVSMEAEEREEIVDEDVLVESGAYASVEEHGEEPREELEMETVEEEEEEKMMEEQVRHVEDFPISSGYDLKSHKAIKEGFARPAARAEKPIDLTPSIEKVLSAPDFTEELRKRVEETVEKILWDVIPSMMEDVRGEVVRVIRDVAKEVVPQIAERIISEEIMKIREEISSGD